MGKTKDGLTSMRGFRCAAGGGCSHPSTCRQLGCAANFISTNKETESPSDPALLSGLSPSEILELGWELRGCLLGSVHDGRDLARSLLGHPILSQYVNTIGADWTENPMSAMVKVKMAIHKDLAR
ncbi:MAG: hypothetical protein AB2777_20620 [Candidatus Thiodiazotropha endolucinida]